MAELREAATSESAASTPQLSQLCTLSSHSSGAEVVGAFAIPRTSQPLCHLSLSSSPPPSTPLSCLPVSVSVADRQLLFRVPVSVSVRRVPSAECAVVCADRRALR